MDPKQKQQIEQYFEKNRNQLVEDVKRLVRIRSDRGDPAQDAPFGEAPKAALLEAVDLCRERGMQTENMDNYVLTADLGPEEPGLDILAHLDVVPVADNWTVCDPFDPVEKDGKLYGRGTADDKGPAVAALWAMACVKELGVPLQRRCRLILGTDEECGGGDIAHYYAANEEAPMTVSPDAEFPVINVEKGMYRSMVHVPLSGDSGIVSVEAGFKLNVVPDTAQAVLQGVDPKEIAPYIRMVARETDCTYAIGPMDDGKIRLICTGEGAHAASPETGNNALTALIAALANLPVQGEDHKRMQALNWLFPHGDYLGEALGVAQSDSISGELTLSLNMCKTVDGELQLQYDCRCPLCATEDNLVKAASAAAASVGLTIDETRIFPPHHVSADSDFIKTLLRCYEEWTGDEGKCLYIGGGTYVHMLKHGVAFGAAMPGVDNRMHGADEFARIDDLIAMGKIYAQTILELCC